MGKSVAIIGGSGFIGTRLTRRLLNEGYHVKIIDKVRSETYPHLWIEGDVRDKRGLIYLLWECEIVYNLAAEHKDNVKPISLYYEVNVKGAEAVCSAAEETGIKKIIFTSTAAVYGFTKKKTDESAGLNPFNEYGRTKRDAEKVYQTWQSASADRSLTVIRPTVVFGEGNRGNVYNLFNQIVNGCFIMIGSGKNIKSMVYVENVVALLEYAMTFGNGYYIFNAVDTPDFDTNSLISLVKKEIGQNKCNLRVPYFIGYVGGMVLDLVTRITNREFRVSAIRVKKFCSDTRFTSFLIGNTGFVPPYTIEEGIKRTIRYEFLDMCKGNKAIFYTE